MTALHSYVSGAWTDPAGDGRPVLDAVTGEQVARVSSAGIDLAAALDYGRSAAGPALRELTFHQRAALLSAVYIVSYLAFSIPALIAGLLITHDGLRNTSFGYGGFVALTALVTLALDRIVVGDPAVGDAPEPRESAAQRE